MPMSIDSTMGEEGKNGQVNATGWPSDRMDVDDNQASSKVAASQTKQQQQQQQNSQAGHTTSRSKVPDDVVANDLAALNEVIANAAAPAALRATVDNWRKCIIGDPKQESFIVRAILKNARPRLWERIFQEQGDNIYKNAPQAFLSYVLDKQIAAVPARELVNLLAKHERLGYREEDIVDEGEFVAPTIESPPAGTGSAPQSASAQPTVLAPVQRGVQPQEPRQIIFHTAPQPSNQVPVQVFRQLQNGEVNTSSSAHSTPPPPRARGEKRFVCDDCNYQFAQAAGLKYHTDNKVCQRDTSAGNTQPKPKFHCENCGRGFTTNGSFKYVTGNGYQNAVFCGACASALAEGRLGAQPEPPTEVEQTPPEDSPSPNSKKKMEERLSRQAKWLADSARQQGLSTTLDNVLVKQDANSKPDVKPGRKSLDAVSSETPATGWATSNTPNQGSFAAVNSGRPAAAKPVSAASTPGSTAEPDPYAHLTPSQLTELNAKIELTDREWEDESTAMENSNEFESQLEKDEALRKLKAIYATKKSIIRRKYGVNLRKRKSGAGAGRELVMGPTPESRKARLEKFKGAPPQPPLAAMSVGRPPMANVTAPGTSSFNVGHPYSAAGSPSAPPAPLLPNPLNVTSGPAPVPGSAPLPGPGSRPSPTPVHVAPSGPTPGSMAQGRLPPPPHQPPVHGYPAYSSPNAASQVQWLPASTPYTGVPGTYSLPSRQPVHVQPSMSSPHSHPAPPPPEVHSSSHPPPYLHDESQSPASKRRRLSFPGHRGVEPVYGTPDVRMIDGRTPVTSRVEAPQHSTPTPAHILPPIQNEPSPAPPPSAESVSKRMNMNRFTSPHQEPEPPRYQVALAAPAPAPAPVPAPTPVPESMEIDQPREVTRSESGMSLASPERRQIKDSQEASEVSKPVDTRNEEPASIVSQPAEQSPPEPSERPSEKPAEKPLEKEADLVAKAVERQTEEPQPTERQPSDQLQQEAQEIEFKTIQGGSPVVPLSAPAADSVPESSVVEDAPKVAATSPAKADHSSPRRRSKASNNEPAILSDDESPPSPRQTRSRDKKPRGSISSKRGAIEEEEEHEDEEADTATRPSRASARNKSRAESPGPSGSGSPMVTRGKSRMSRGAKPTDTPDRKASRSVRSTRSSFARAGN